MPHASRPSALTPSSLVAARWVLLAGLAVAGAGCTAETPSNAPAVPESEKGVVQKTEEKVIEIGHKVEGAAGSAAKATGNAIVEGGKKLETSAAESVRENVGTKAGDIVESVGKGMEKAGSSLDKGGDKLKEAAKP